ncbi:hypothetical protein D3C80_964870 [compost metagenome]
MIGDTLLRSQDPAPRRHAGAGGLVPGADRHHGLHKSARLQDGRRPVIPVADGRRRHRVHFCLLAFGEAVAQDVQGAAFAREHRGADGQPVVNGLAAPSAGDFDLVGQHGRLAGEGRLDGVGQRWGGEGAQYGAEGEEGYEADHRADLMTGADAAPGPAYVAYARATSTERRRRGWRGAG